MSKTKKSKKVVKKESKKVVKVVKKVIKEPKIEIKPFLEEEKAYNLIKRYSLPMAKTFFLKKDKELPLIVKKMHIPIILKSSGKTIVHRTAIFGIKKDVNNPEQSLEAFNTLLKVKGTEKVILQEQIPGIEMIIGAKKDAEFGAVVSLAIGGKYAEVLKEISFRVAPLTEEDSKNMILGLKGFEIIIGNINIDSLASVLVKVGKLILNEKISELNINPIICNKEGCSIVDVKIYE